MALELKLTIGTYDRSTSKLPLTDTTGNYNATTNPGGYGAPNPDRNSFALVVVSRRVGSQAQDTQVDTDPLTDASWNFEFKSDGVYEMYLAAIPFETSPDVSLLAEGYVFWETVDEKVYVVKDGALEETDKVIDDVLHISEIQYFLVSSFSENVAIDMFCSAFSGGACKGLRSEYNDLNRVLDSIKCLYGEAYYKKADEQVALAQKIKI